MIGFKYEKKLHLDEEAVSKWIISVIGDEGYELGELCYTFLSDDELYSMNLEYLGHDTYTDIISFDYTVGKVIQGDIFISIDRVNENAGTYGVNMDDELLRVMIHGVLHYCGYKDRLEKDKELMRAKEDFYLKRYL